MGIHDPGYVERNRQAWQDFKEDKITRDELIKRLHRNLEDSVELGRKPDGIRKGDGVYCLSRKSEGEEFHGVVTRIVTVSGEKDSVYVAWHTVPETYSRISYDDFRDRWTKSFGGVWYIEDD